MNEVHVFPLRRMYARSHKTPYNSHSLCVQCLRLGFDETGTLHRLRNTVGLARVDGFAGLLDLLQDGCVVQALLGCDGCGLALKGDVEVLDAWKGMRVSYVYSMNAARGGLWPYHRASSARALRRRSSRRRSW